MSTVYPPATGPEAFEVALAEFADDLAHGFTPTGHAARIVSLWVDDHDRRDVAQALVDALDARECAGGCGAYLAHETVGGTIWCGESIHYCTDCFTDVPRGCPHPEHW